MPNHWHLVLWPLRDGDLGCFMQKLTTTHGRRWHLHHHSVGTGHLHQGTYKTVPTEEDDHLDTVLRGVERKAVRPTMVERTEDWTWNSLWRWLHPTEHQEKPIFRPWPIPRPHDWVTRVNRVLTKKREAVQASVVRGRPFGSESWQEATAKQLGLESTFRPRGRPKKAIDDSKSYVV